MSDALIGSIIGGIVALTVCLITNWSNRKKDAIVQARRDQKLEDKIEEIDRKLEEHNGLSDRIVTMEKAIVRIETTLSQKG